MEETPKSAVEETVVSLLADPAAVPVLVSPAADDEAWRVKIETLQLQFNTQRASMRKMFLQKEADCKKLQAELDDAHSRLAVAALGREDGERKANEEIVSLQQVVNETIDESGYLKSEIERLLAELERIQHENVRLSGDLTVLAHQHQESSSLAPMLNNVKKTIARKLGADTTGSDYLEDSMRKAQEDAEVLRSLVVPLEEEIKALKEKLRNTDDELQTCQRQAALGGAGAVGRTVESALVGLLERSSDANTFQTTAAIHPETDTTVDSAAAAAAAATPRPPSPAPLCADCATHTATITTVTVELSAARKEVEHVRTELEREASLRRQLEAQWQEKRDEHKHEVQSLDERVARAEREYQALRQFYGEAKETMRKQLARLTGEREQTMRHLEQLQQDNDFLAGRFAATAAELQNERIDMPCNVDDLQVCLLRSHEDLIETRVGYELEQRRSRTYCDEARMLADKQRDYEHEAETKIKALRGRIGHLEAERARLNAQKEALQLRETEFERQASELRVQEIELRATSERLTQLNGDLRQKSTVLQQELATSEAVQQDFVRLSQSLQVELEKIRAADSTVRWQDEDDVDQCPSCRTAFAVTRRQVNCRHCGTIYCEKCITKSVLSGRRRKAARVCDVCHTLLERNTAPYFSQAPPQSPT